MKNANLFYEKLKKIDEIELFKKPITGITLFRPKAMEVNEFLSNLPKGVFAKCKVREMEYVRSVALNPMADIEKIIDLIKITLKS